MEPPDPMFDRNTPKHKVIAWLVLAYSAATMVVLVNYVCWPYRWMMGWFFPVAVGVDACQRYVDGNHNKWVTLCFQPYFDEVYRESGLVSNVLVLHCYPAATLLANKAKYVLTVANGKKVSVIT